MVNYGDNALYSHVPIPHATGFELAVALIWDTLHCQYTAPALLMHDNHWQPGGFLDNHCSDDRH